MADTSSLLREENLTPNSSPIRPIHKKPLSEPAIVNFDGIAAFGGANLTTGSNSNGLDSSYLSSSSSSAGSDDLMTDNSSMLITTDFVVATEERETDSQAFLSSQETAMTNASREHDEYNSSSSNINDDGDYEMQQPPATLNRLPLGPLRRQSLGGPMQIRKTPPLPPNSRRASLDPRLLPVMPRVQQQSQPATLSQSNATETDAIELKQDNETASFQDDSMESFDESTDHDDTSGSHVQRHQVKRRQTLGGNLLPPRPLAQSKRRMTLEPGLVPPWQMNTSATTTMEAAAAGGDVEQAPSMIHTEGAAMNASNGESIQIYTQESVFDDEEEDDDFPVAKHPRRQSIAGVPADPPVTKTSSALRRRMSMGPGVPRPKQATTTVNTNASINTRIMTQTGHSDSAATNEQAPMEDLTTDYQDETAGLLMLSTPKPHDPRRHTLDHGSVPMQSTKQSANLETRRMSMGPGIDMTSSAAMQVCRLDGNSSTPGSNASAATTPGSAASSNGKSSSKKNKRPSVDRLLVRAEEAKKRRIAKEMRRSSIGLHDSHSEQRPMIGSNDTARVLSPMKVAEHGDTTASFGSSFLLTTDLEDTANQTHDARSNNTHRQMFSKEIDNQNETIITNDNMLFSDGASTSRPSSTSFAGKRDAESTETYKRGNAMDETADADALAQLFDSDDESDKRMSTATSGSFSNMLGEKAQASFHSPGKTRQISSVSSRSPSSTRSSIPVLGSPARPPSVLDVVLGKSPTRERSPHRPAIDRHLLDAQATSPFKSGKVRESLLLSPIPIYEDDNNSKSPSGSEANTSRERRIRNMDSLLQYRDELTTRLDRPDLFMYEQNGAAALPTESGLETNCANDGPRENSSLLIQDVSLTESLHLSPAQSTRSAQRRRKLASTSDGVGNILLFASTGKKRPSRKNSIVSPRRENLTKDDSGADDSTPSASTLLNTSKSYTSTDNDAGFSAVACTNEESSSPGGSAAASPTRKSVTPKGKGKHLQADASKSPKRYSQRNDVPMADSPARNTRSAEKARLFHGDSDNAILPVAATLSEAADPDHGKDSNDSLASTRINRSMDTIDANAAIDKSTFGSPQNKAETTSIDYDANTINFETGTKGAEKRILDDTQPTRSGEKSMSSPKSQGSMTDTTSAEKRMHNNTHPTFSDEKGMSSPNSQRSKIDSNHQKSALRKNNASHSSSKKSVAFGLPEIRQFHLGSPVGKLTPVTKSPSCPSSNAGRTPLKTSALANQELSDDSSMNMSVDSESPNELDGMSSFNHALWSEEISESLPEQVRADAEETVELEANMSDLFSDNHLFPRHPTFLETVNERTLDGSLSTTATSAMEIDETVQLAAVSLLPLMHPADDEVTERMNQGDVTRLSFADFADEMKQDCGQQPIPTAHKPVVATEPEIFSSAVRLRSAPHSVDRRQRRTPRSGRRLTLTPQPRLSLAANGDVIINDPQVKVAPALNFDESPPKKEVLDLQVSELVEAVQLLGLSSGDSIDIICDIHQAIINTRCPNLFQKYELSMAGVCQELHIQCQKEFGMDLDVGTSEESELHLLTLQHAVRSPSESEVDLQHFANAAFEETEFDLDVWLVQLVSQMLTLLQDYMQEVTLFSHQVDDNAKFIDEEAEVLSTLNSKAFDKARRRSLDRRKTAAAVLEEEIAILEANINRVDLIVEQSEKRLATLNEIDRQTDLSSTLCVETATLQVETAHLDRRYSMAKSCSMLTPTRLTANEISFYCVGPCPAACFCVTFQPVNSTESWRCDFNVQEELFADFVGRPIKSVTPLYQLRIQSLACAAKQMELHPSKIGFFLQELNSKMNRMQQTAVELASLKRRYPASSLFVDEDDDLVFKVTFKSRVCAKTFFATFEVTESYPFLPVTVDVDGDVKFDKVLELLKKHAQPGFGYLSRTCDLLAAHFRCETESALTKFKK
ncbi:hypothetical protein MPSEU_000989700 [Mayamaea pseudoterrestris]|nr:hypothetical protein MPSEU_000989700 [Mayamaea pseudoterrestris]